MIFEYDESKIFIDHAFKGQNEFIISCFEAIKKLLQPNFYFFFLSDLKSESAFRRIVDIQNILKMTSEEAMKEFEKLSSHIKESNTSFSWGFEDVEFIFIILTKESDWHFLDHAPALIGLLIHEMIHGLERQRGLEDDLKRSFAISLETFQEYTKMISSSRFNNDDLMDLFKSIGETAIYVLKDLYVDREAIERGFATEILEQYKTTFNIYGSLDGSKLPEMSIDLSQIQPESIDLAEFKIAFLILLSLVPVWLPFIKISKGFERDQALELKKFIDETYSKVSFIGERFTHLENIYLTEFAFTKSFHVKWFSEIFSMVIDLLSGGEFIIWQFSGLVIKLEEYISFADSLQEEIDTYSIKDLILVPVLKSAFIFSKSKSTLEMINEEIEAKLRLYIPEDEMTEWESDFIEYSIENLLLFVLSELIRLLRQEFLESMQNLRLYTGLILDVLQILTDIKKDINFLDKYLVMKKKISQFIVERDSRFLSLKILYPLECEIEQMIFEDEPAFTAEEAEEFLQIARFYALPKSNWVLELAKRVATIIKMNLTKAEKRNEDLSVDVVAMTIMVLTKDFHMGYDPELLVPLVRTTLMSLRIPTYEMKEILKIYGNLINM